MENYQEQNQYTRQPVNQEMAPVITTKDWLLSIFLGGITFGILFFVWAFDGSTNPSKKNWARANLIYVAIVIILEIIIFGLLFLVGFLAAAN